MMSDAPRGEHSRSVTSCHGQRYPLEQPLGFPTFACALADATTQFRDELEARGPKDSCCLHRQGLEPMPHAQIGIFSSFESLRLLCGCSHPPGALRQVGRGEGVYTGGIPA